MKHTYYYIEFICEDSNYPINKNLHAIQTRVDIDYHYLKCVYTQNKIDPRKRDFFTIPLTWYNDNKQHNVPKLLTVENNITDEILLNGIIQAKKDALAIIVKHEYNKYINANDNKIHYYQLQEKEALKYISNKNIKSKYLDLIAQRKNITVDELVNKILNRINIHNNIIMNRAHIIEDISNEMSNMTFEELYRLELFDLVKDRLFKVNETIESNEEDFINPLHEKIVYLDNKINNLGATIENTSKAFKDSIDMAIKKDNKLKLKYGN
jgi:hypothetical protein